LKGRAEYTVRRAVDYALAQQGTSAHGLRAAKGAAVAVARGAWPFAARTNADYWYSADSPKELLCCFLIIQDSPCIKQHRKARHDQKVHFNICKAASF